MRKVNLYAIRDNVGDFFNNPSCFMNDEIAIRSFHDLVNAGESEVANHPSDFALFRLGVFDKIDGTVKAEKDPVRVCSGIDVHTKGDKQ